MTAGLVISPHGFSVHEKSVRLVADVLRFEEAKTTQLDAFGFRRGWHDELLSDDSEGARQRYADVPKPKPFNIDGEDFDSFVFLSLSLSLFLRFSLVLSL